MQDARNLPCDRDAGDGTHNQSAGTWSDDTSPPLALADGFLSDEVSLAGITYRFTDWYNNAAYTPHGKVFDAGSATAKAIRRLKKV